MEIKIIAGILLALRIMSMVFIGAVLRKQIALLRTNTYPEVSTIRKALFALAVVIFLGQFIPILIDFLALTSTIRRSTPSVIGVAYAFSNAFTAVIASFLLWLVYRLTEQSSAAVKEKK